MRDLHIGQIADGMLGLDDLLADHFLHGRLYGGIWTWAGRFRARELNLGVAPEQIAVGLRSSLDTIRCRRSSKSGPSGPELCGGDWML